MSLNLTGNLSERLAEVASQVPDAARRGLAIGGEHVLGVSNTLVPIETGALARSGSVSQDDTELLTAVSYDTEYAVRQHEDTSLNHDAGRQAKFLQTAMESQASAVADIVANQLRRALGT